MSISRIHTMVPVLLLLLAAISLSGCANRPAQFGQYFQGRALVVSVVNMHRLPELRYATPGAENGPQYARLAPSEAGLELVVVRLKVENHTATSAIINVNEQGAELRDFSSEKYFPIAINERVEFVDSPSGARDRSTQVLELQGDGTFAPSRGFINGPFELNKNTGLDGWMVFEAPEGTKFRSFRWRAGDSLTIDFSPAA